MPNRYSPLLFCLLSGTVSAQTVMQLSFARAMEMASSSGASAAVEVAETSVQIIQARAAQARALKLPVIETQVSEQNQTRNLSAQGFNFPTGVPNFTIPDKVGPYFTFDARVIATQNLFDASAVHRARGIQASMDAARADVTVARERSIVAVAHDYLAALRAIASVEAAQAGLDLDTALLATAEDRVENGKVPALEATRAKGRLALDRRRLAAAHNESKVANLQLQGDLGISYGTRLELTDRLSFIPGEVNDPDAAVTAAFGSRAELHVSRSKEEEARDNDEAIRRERVPSAIAFADVGPLASVITHTVGVSVKIPIFDGGRRDARRAEVLAVVHQYEAQQRELRRQIELQVRRASANLESARAQLGEADNAIALAEEELASARRRFEGGVTGNSDVVEAQARAVQAREDRIAILFTWNQARVDLAQATGSVSQLRLSSQ